MSDEFSKSMRVLLVEDEPDLGAAIKKALSREKYIVDWVQDGAEAWEHLDQQWTQYTFGVFDWLVPSLSGLELCKRLRAASQIPQGSRNNALLVIMLTAKHGLEDKIEGLDAGADDYLVKPFRMGELLARMRALRRRSPQLQPDQLEVGNLTLNYGNSTISVKTSHGQQPIALTAKEFQLLEHFMTHPNQLVTRDQLLYQVWKMDASIESNVVAAQLRLLRRKLAEHGCEDLIETVYGLGYRLSQPG
jgi:DNA-binding response OmpR family regulator